MAGQVWKTPQLGSKPAKVDLVGAVDSLIDNAIVAELNQEGKSVKFFGRNSSPNPILHQMLQVPALNLE